MNDIDSVIKNKVTYEKLQICVYNRQDMWMCVRGLKIFFIE